MQVNIKRKMEIDEAGELGRASARVHRYVWTIPCQIYDIRFFPFRLNFVNQIFVIKKRKRMQVDVMRLKLCRDRTI